MHTPAVASADGGAAAAATAAASGTWSALKVRAPPPSPRTGHVAVAARGGTTLRVVGGWNELGAAAADAWHGDVYDLDLATWTWSRVTGGGGAWGGAVLRRGAPRGCRSRRLVGYGVRGRGFGEGGGAEGSAGDAHAAASAAAAAASDAVVVGGAAPGTSAGESVLHDDVRLLPLWGGKGEESWERGGEGPSAAAG